MTSTLAFTFNGFGGTDLMLVNTSNGDPIPTGNVSLTGENPAHPGRDAHRHRHVNAHRVTLAGDGAVNLAGHHQRRFRRPADGRRTDRDGERHLGLADGLTATNSGTLPGGYAIDAVAA